MSLADEASASTSASRTKTTLDRIAELIERAGIPAEEIGAVSRVSLYQEVLDGTGGWIRFDPKWKDGPAWPVVNYPPPVRIAAPTSPPKPRSGFKRCVILPDVQIGYRDLQGSLDPFHDEAAMDVALQIVKEVDPDLVILLGDTFDFPAHSKYVQEPTWARTTQAAIDRGHTFFADITARSPRAADNRYMLEGNHDFRLAQSVMVNAAASYGLQRANMPESWPVLSVPHLARMDEVGWNYLAGYPANEFWINDRLRCIHGLKIKSNGSTANLVAEDERVSTIFGHIHRIELQHRTRHVRDGARMSLAASLGCLSRIDGAVPSVKGGIDLNGRPLVQYENWQQAVGVVSYEEGDGPFNLEIVPIHFGSAIYRGQTYSV